MVAVVTVSLSGIGGASVAVFEYEKRRSDIAAAKDTARCTSAYEYLRDDRVNQDSVVNERVKFAREQMNVARECSRRDTR